MHIPDGYLSPETCAVMYGASAPFWVMAAKRVRKVVKTRYVPLLALGAAYCFLVMMFNVPIPDGTTAHAVGGVLMAVLLGPWAAVIAVSVALLIQALFFGDGGVLAYGANCFNMAVGPPFTGYAVYKLLARRTSLTSAPPGPGGGRRRLRRHQRRRPVRRDRVRRAARALLQDRCRRHAHPALRAVPPVADDPHDAARPPPRGRRRRARADRRRRRLPAAGQPAGATDQPRRRARDGRRPAAAAQDRAAGRRRRPGRRCRCWCRSGCWPPAPPSARTRPTSSTSSGTASSAVPTGLSKYTDCWRTRCSPAMTSRTAATRRSATTPRPCVGTLLIGGVILAAFVAATRSVAGTTVAPVPT